MEESDIPAGMELKKAAGWNQLEEDWELFLKASRKGSIVAEKGGKVIGTAVNINYDRRFCWIGMVLVDPSCRRMGVGTTLLNEAINLGTGKGTIRLDATPAGKLLYDTLGFTDEYNLKRYQLDFCDPNDLPDPDRHCDRMMPDDLDKVIRWDEEVFGASRSIILKSLFRMGRDYAWIRNEDSGITGYCFGRPGSNFEQVGPIIARDVITARSLLVHALQSCTKKAVIIDVPDHQEDFSAWIKGYGFKVQRPFIRMYSGKLMFPGLPVFQYAIAGPEIG